MLRALLVALACVLLCLSAEALQRRSSHSEAPGTAENPSGDLTDFYFFRSYEKDREDYVVMQMNVQPLQDAFRGPNYYALSSDFVYSFHIDSDGDAEEDLSFQFSAGNEFGGKYNAVTDTHEGLAVPVPLPFHGTPLRDVAIPLAHVGPLHTDQTGRLDIFNNYKEFFQLRVVRGPVADDKVYDNGPFAVSASNNTQDTFRIPFDNAGRKTFPDGYETYALEFQQDVKLPLFNCAQDARVFVGQRRDPFYINLGQIFDLINIPPAPSAPFVDEDPKYNFLAEKGVTTIALEVHRNCLRGASPNGVVGAWATASLLEHVTQGSNTVHEVHEQTNRMGNPLVNELLIGLPQKNEWNQAAPADDNNFLEYYQYPTVPEIVELLFGDTVRGVFAGKSGNPFDTSNSQSLAPSFYPRGDLVAILLQGAGATGNAQERVGGGDVPLSDMIRLNLDQAPTPRDKQSPLGVIGGDKAGYPNGRRPGDDVVDITLRVAMGVVCHLPLGICDPNQAPIGNLPLTDRAPLSAFDFYDHFPYFTEPAYGSDLPCRETTPATISTASATQVCEGADETIRIDVDEAGNGSFWGYLILDSSDNIVRVFGGRSRTRNHIQDLATSELAEGQYRVVRFDYHGQLTGVREGEPLSGVRGVVAYSNMLSFTVRSCASSPATISLDDNTNARTICFNEGPVPLTVQTTAPGNFQATGFVITNALTGEILALPPHNGPFDLTGAGFGVCNIYRFNSVGPVQNLAVGNNIADVLGDVSLSQPIRVTRVDCSASTGIIRPLPVSNTGFCVEDGPIRLDFQVIGDKAGDNFGFLWTDLAGVIVRVDPGPTPILVNDGIVRVTQLYSFAAFGDISTVQVGNTLSDLEINVKVSNPITIQARRCGPVPPPTTTTTTPTTTTTTTTTPTTTTTTPTTTTTTPTTTTTTTTTPTTTTTTTVNCSGCATCNSVANPQLTDLCELNVLLLVDESGSLRDNRVEVVQALDLFWDALSDISININVAAWSFNDNVALRTFFSFRPVNSNTVQMLRNSFANYNPSGGTDWGLALQLASQVNFSGGIGGRTSPDLVIMLTDGNPTRSRRTCSSSCPVAASLGGDIDLATACAAADLLKQDSRLFVVGVGGASSEEFAIRTISGPTQWDRTREGLINADYVLEPSLAQLATLLNDVSNAFCDSDNDRK